MILICSASTIYNFVFDMDNNSNIYPLILDKGFEEYQTYIYFKSWTRLTPYILGLFVG